MKLHFITNELTYECLIRFIYKQLCVRCKQSIKTFTRSLMNSKRQHYSMDEGHTNSYTLQNHLKSMNTYT